MEISLPSSLLRLAVSAASNPAAGRAVMTIPAEVTPTPTEAAELLGRVFIDTNVLFPFSVMDLMLALTEDGIHDVFPAVNGQPRR